MLTPAIKDLLLLDLVAGDTRGAIRKSVKDAESPQGWLPFDDFPHVRRFREVDGRAVDLRNASLEQYREAVAVFEKKVSSYSYARRAEAKAKNDKRELREMKRLDGKLAPYFAGNPAMTMGLAAEMHAASLKTPAKQQRKAASVGGHKARWART